MFLSHTMGRAIRPHTGRRYDSRATLGKRNSTTLRHDSFRPMVAVGEADPAVPSLDAEPSSPLFVDDVALTPRN